MTRRHTVLAMLLGLTLTLTGCGKDATTSSADDTAAASTSPSSASPSATTDSTPSQPVPKVGQCYRLDYRSATSPTSSAPPVPCRSPHTSVTMFVGTIDAVDDGHLLAVDSTKVQDQLATTCPRKVAGWVGGDEDERRLSRFDAVWFSPTLEDADAGATWYRCDLVAVQGENQLADLPGSAKDALVPDGALDRFGTCGNAAPSATDFQRVVCSRRHSWAAVAVLPIAQNARYLGPKAQASGDDACKAQAQDRATDPLTYTWSFEWPARKAWDAGQRYGLCWVPSS